MVPVRDIVKGALKKLSVLPIGREPNPAQGEDGLVALQALYRELIGQGAFGRLNDVLVQQPTYDARESDRVVCDYPQGVKVNLPKTVTSSLICGLPAYDESASDYGRGSPSEPMPRPPRDGAVIVVADVHSSKEDYYLYDANRAYWAKINDLTLDSPAPLSGRFENGLKAKLGLRLAASYNRQPSPLLIGEVQGFHSALSLKQDRARRRTVVEYY